MDKKQIEKSLNLFKKRVRKKFNPKQIILYGSFAQENARDYSDVDIVVIAEKFKAIPQEKRFDALYELTKDLCPDFHVFGFTHEEFNRPNKLTILEEIKQHGIPLL